VKGVFYIVMNIQRFNFFESIVNHINISILDHGIADCDTSWNYENFSSPFTRLYFIIDGEGLLNNHQHEIKLLPGSLYLVPMNSTYNYICNSYMKMLYFHLRLELSYGQDLFSHIDSCMSIAIDSKAVFSVIDTLKSKNLTDIMYTKSFVLEMCSKFIPCISNTLDIQISNAIKYDNIFKYLKNNFSPDLTINKISQQFNLSPNSLAKAFKNDIGITLKDYIDKLLLQNAKEKLLLTDMNIKEIAYQLNFCDEFYFSKYFKRHTGLSPREYRQNNKLY
jgi:YesN/AraC family two-component response regulator